jgi:hypothetical protein
VPVAKKRSILNITDFSGGYSTNLPDDRMPNNMLRTGENVYWEDGLRKRKGWSTYGETFPSAANFLYGSIRAYMNSKWTHVVAVSLTASPTTIRFMTDNATAKTYVEIDATFTKAAEIVKNPDRVRFAIMKVNGEDAVIGVDKVASFKPFVIYYDSGFKIENLEEYDIRTRTNDDWYAGQYDVSETPPYIDDTTDAQDETADDFQVMSTDAGDGFYVSGVVQFNKVVLTSVSQFNTDPDPTYEYYIGDDTWAAATPLSPPDWTAAAGDRTIEFNIPVTPTFDEWKVWDGADATGGTGTLINRYIFRVRFGTAPSGAQTADYITVYHSQYLTQVMSGDIPHQIATHNSTLFLAAGSNVQYSPYGQITGWDFDRVESFIRGGDKIQAMLTHRGYLCVFKGASIYGLFGNSVDNWVIKELDTTIGTDYATSLAVVNQIIYFVGSDGYLYAFNGDVSKQISKHIHDDMTTFLASYVPYGIHFEGNFYLFLGPNILRFDPDTMREDDLGDGRVSFWKYTTEVSSIATLTYPVYFKGDQDTQALIAQNTDEYIQVETSAYKDVYSGDNNIALDVKTKDITFGQFGQKKNYNRIKPDVERAGNWTFTMLADHESTNTAVTMETGAGPGQYTEDISVPYTIDGKDLTLRFQNTSAVFAAIYGYALNVARRVF